ncbi:MAG TPA: PIN domain-containing protein [Kofleriaceae bacterium]|nr:PIN domain-containing protein [Kofleriaceae bacterium]
MADRVFIDTNVLVYADDPSGGVKRDRAIDVLSALVTDERAVLSTQVLQEYFVVATRKVGLAPEQARRRVEVLSKLDVVVVRPELIVAAIDLHRLHSISFWDALVVRAASVAGCACILSEDLNGGQSIDGVTIVNPFAPGGRAGEPKGRHAISRGRKTRGELRSRL